MGMILLPSLTIYAFSKLTSVASNFEDLCESFSPCQPLLPLTTRSLVRLIYPSIFVMVAVSQFAMSLIGVFTKWTQGIRDKEFLVELRLRNLDHPRKLERAEPLPVVESGAHEDDELGGEDED